ncbi:MAG: NAD(P)H-hydrate dehydratase [Rudaea sp.]
MESSPTQASALFSVAHVREIEKTASATLGIAGVDLMQRAAKAAYHLLRERWPHARRIAIVCGSGNNAGDGYSLATLALRDQLDVEVVALAPPRPGSEAAFALAEWTMAGGKVGNGSAWPRADVYVDALFGVGLARAPDGQAEAWIERLNDASGPVLSLDVPSGVNADTGATPGSAVRANATITFIAQKRGLHTGAALNFCGEVFVDALRLPPEAFSGRAPDAYLLDDEEVAHSLVSRPRNANKGSFGHVIAIGGDVGMGGAIRLAGEAALRVGAGLVSVATQAAHIAALNSGRPELMAHGVDGVQELQALLERASVVAIGPGLGQRAWGHALWHTAIAAGKPLVLDADALNLLARERVTLPDRCVLTPHPGEAARLLGVETKAVLEDRFAAVRELAHRHRAVVVLKGAGTLVANPHGQTVVCPWGNPGMASGGTGDVLTGVIAGLLAQGFEPWQAARLGVALHARAGDCAAANGEAGMLASDLFAPLRRLRNGLGAT